MQRLQIVIAQTTKSDEREREIIQIARSTISSDIINLCVWFENWANCKKRVRFGSREWCALKGKRRRMFVRVRSFSHYTSTCLLAWQNWLINVCIEFIYEQDVWCTYIFIMLFLLKRTLSHTFILLWLNRRVCVYTYVRHMALREGGEEGGKSLYRMRHTYDIIIGVHGIKVWIGLLILLVGKESKLFACLNCGLIAPMNHFLTRHQTFFSSFFILSCLLLG